MKISYLLGVAALCAFATARGQNFPDHPIRMVVPAAAGGSTDISARVIARKLHDELQQTVVVENKGGGGGRIGANEVARADADGYTLLFGNSIGQALLPAVAKVMPYTVDDFAPIGQTFWYSTLIVCNPDTPFNDLAGLIEYAKANPGKLTIATAGPGSGNHFSSELLASMANVRFLHVPYKGNAPAALDVISGRADCMHMGEAKPYLDSGRLKAIATTGLTRDPRFPDVPTVDEAGLKGYDATWWQGVFAPAGTPQPIIDKLSAAVRKVTEDPSTRQEMFEAGMVPEYLAPDEVMQRVAADMEKFRQIAKDANISFD